MSIEGTAGFALVGTHAALDVLVLLLVFQYHRRRNYQPIKSRFYWQGEATALLLIPPLFLSACATEFEPYISCDVYLVVILVIFNAVVPIVIRAAHVYSAYEVSKVYAQRGSSNAEGEAFANGNIFLRRAQVIQSFKVQVAVFLVLASFHTLTWVIFTQAFNPTCNGIDEMIFIVIIGSFYVGVTLFLGWNISTLKDGLYIRRELVLVAAGGVAVIPTFAALRFSFDSYYYANLALAFGPFWVIGVQIGMPLYKTYTWQRSKSKEEADLSSDELSLTTAKSSEKLASQPQAESTENWTDQTPASPAEMKRVLSIPESFELFLEFSRLELNHENVLFYHEVTPWLQRIKLEPDIVNSAEFGEAAWRIYNKYISNSAKLQVNLSAGQHARFAEAGFEAQEEEQLNHELALEALQEAWKEVFALMYRDMFGRFRRSPRYLEFREQAV